MSKQKTEQTPPAGMQAVTEKSTLPIIAIGGVWLLWALLFPLYSLKHYLLCGAVSVLCYLLLRGMVPDRVRYEPIPQVSTGDAQADALLKQGRETLAQIQQTADTLQNAAVRQKIEGLEGTCQRILEHLQAHPKASAGLRRFLNYYLPTLQKLTAAYALMERQGVEGENISGSMERIETLLDTLDGAFRKQLDALFSDTALDVDSDITVMEQLMAQEGLTEQPSPGMAAADTIPDPLGKPSESGGIELKL